MKKAEISCIIVEDEKPAQEVLKSFIDKTDWLLLKATLEDAVSALDYLKDNSVDLIFLDIQMPVLTGVDFLKVLQHPPQVIITTAYSEYAIEAFELDVRDYLMKPFSFERFLKAVNRITRETAPTLVHEISKGEEGKFDHLFFNVNKTMVRVRFEDILYAESMREYIYLHTTKGKVVTKISTNEIEKLLGPGFVRIHRSFIVNISKVTAYNAEDVFIEQVIVPIGVSYKKEVDRTFGKFLYKASD